jgi:hypothetical protein
MENGGIVGVDDFFCLLKRIKLSLKASTVKRLDPFDLACIEHACIAKNGTIQAIGALYFLVSVRIFFRPCRCAGEIADSFSVLSSADVPALIGALKKSHPARIGIPIHGRRDAKIYCVKPTIDGLGNRIVRSIRNVSSLPWTYPRSSALLKTLDDALRHLLGIGESRTARFAGAHGLPPPQGVKLPLNTA